MAEPTLYLFDGYNLLHAGGFADQRELIDTLASFVAHAGARGVVVFDGAGADERIGPLDVRFATHADAVLERLAAEHRGREAVCLVSSDAPSAARPARRCGSVSSRSASCASCRRPRALGGRDRSGSATASTTRRASGSSGCAAASSDASARANICSYQNRSFAIPL